MSSSASGPGAGSSPDPRDAHAAPASAVPGPSDSTADGPASGSTRSERTSSDGASAEAPSAPASAAADDAATPDAGQAPVPQLTRKQASRINAPIRGMVISMLVLILLLLPFLWLQPKPDAQPYRAHVDVSEEARFAGDQAPFTPAAPALGDGWSANYARWEAQSQDGVPLWNVGFLSPGYHLVDMAQTARSNPTWLAQRTQLIPPTDERTVNGITWQIHHRDASGKQDEFTAWVGELKDSTVVLSGQAPNAEFEHVARAVSGQ
ncbi:DUF4245 domain-containing protein [Kocuria marina]|uniref:DUF4245 domain-containing protein n=1 Tax=Kocuria marina subsp. indica TaxID=1049583 RepID=A0A1X7D8H3_9MICC|nr:DUF4245 domain-containing protein [Kocuria indica]OXS82985.1 hypothetical protein B1B07_07395 [Kocuria indica]RLP57777.1 DUF4245 domain-containing protein [Kocuria indica]SMF10733.1 Protein of unknown function [Kocuria indica]